MFKSKVFVVVTVHPFGVFRPTQGGKTHEPESIGVGSGESVGNRVFDRGVFGTSRIRIFAQS